MDSYSIFQQPWWLDAVAPGQWDAVEVERGGETAAWLPFVVKKRLGLRLLTQPALTQSLGPWIKDTGAGHTKALGREMSLYKELIGKLPQFDIFQQNFAPQVTNWLPFYWQGFTQTTRYTYTIDLSRDLEQLFADMDKRNRRQLRDAEREIYGESADDLRELLVLNDKTFERQGMKTPYTHAYVHQIDAAAREHAQRWIILARDRKTGQALAGIYMIGFQGRVYSLFSGVDPASRAKNPGIVARWEAIKQAKSYGTILDLQGSMLEGVERRNRNYGATQSPYFAMSKADGFGKLALTGRRLLRGF